MTAEELGRKVSEQVDEFGACAVKTDDLEALGLGRKTLAYADWLHQHRLRMSPPTRTGWIYFRRMPEAPKFPRLSYAPRLPGEHLAMTTRRTFLASILAAGAAPAIVRPASLMPIWTPPKFNAADFIIDPATEDSITKIVLCSSDGSVSVFDCGPLPFVPVASTPIDADSPLRPWKRGVFNRL